MTKLGSGALVIVVLCACASTSFAQSNKQTLDPLQSYIQNNDVANNPVAAEYVTVRCVAFYTAGASAMDSETDPQMVPLKNSALARAANLMAAAVTLDAARTGRSEKESATEMNAAAVAIGRAYAALMKADKTEQGDISKDPVFTGDSDVCRALPGAPQ